MNEFMNYFKYFFIEPYNSELFYKFESYIWNIDIIGFIWIILWILIFWLSIAFIIWTDFLKLYLWEKKLMIFLDKYTVYKKGFIVLFIWTLLLLIISHIILFIIT